MVISTAALRQLRTLFHIGAIGELTDGQLLERFATARDEAAGLAFAALVERHGPIVLRVCRAVLRDEHEAQDAFQATFLILVRKSGSLWVRDSLGPWLHQVAYRAAHCSRSAMHRRRVHERKAAEMASARIAEGGDRMELCGVLHEEIEQLPERYRAPLVLCELEGCTHEQAARHLGCPVGTVKSRLARGRERLRDRLTRRGLAPNAGLLASALRPDGPNTSIPPALVDSTTAVAQFVVTQTIVRGAAASLAQGVLRSMILTRWLKVASVLLALGATASGVALLAQEGTSGVKPRLEENLKAARDDMPVSAVKPGKLRVTVVERGNLEASKSVDVFCEVEGAQNTIIMILPEGRPVKKGDLVCELDSSTLKDNLTNQKITVQRAETAFQNAKLAHEAAEIAVKEYVEGTFQQEQDTLKGAIAAAQSAIQKADARLERTRRARKRFDDALAPKGGPSTPAEIVAELDIEDRLEATEQTLVREKMALELATTKQGLLEKYTRDRMTKELTAEAGRKGYDELASRDAWEFEKIKQARLSRQIEKCKVYAPGAGLLMYANDTSGRPGLPMIEEGATVRERQKIFSIPDPSSPMRVNTKVRESMVDRLGKGLPARIKVDAFPKETLTGVVEIVAPLPDSSSFFRTNTKVYSTLVRVDKGLPGLRPGMTAKVEILVTELDNVLSVPVPAVLHYDGKDHVAVKIPGGVIWREVTLGLSNDKLVEVKQGIQSGESVILNPLSLMSEQEKLEKFGEPSVTPPAAKTSFPR